MKPWIFVVDDEQSLREYLSILLAKSGYKVRAFASGLELLESLREHTPDLILLDLKMPGMDGIQVLEKVRTLDPNIPVIIMTAYGTIQSAIEAIQKGAFYYITKPFELSELKIQIQKALEYRQLKQENLQLKQELSLNFQIVGQNPEFLKVLDIVRKVAQTDATVLIQGESGTGKELIARALHQNSRRASYPFIAINCAALPEELLESELFGYEKGAFTGATQAKEGLFRAAHRGTLFLDEIGEISPRIQVKLLRALQEKEIIPLGSTRAVQVDVRILASTNRNLEELMRQGVFREDLYYRLNVITIRVPPLRERKDDIPLLVDHFVKKYAKKHAIPPKRVPREVMDLLLNYSWPGNVRELENAIERAMILSPGDTLSPQALPPQVRGLQPGEEVPLPPPTLTLEELERRYILKVLEEVGWDKARAAQILGINLSTVYRKLARFGIKVNPGERGLQFANPGSQPEKTPPRGASH